MSVIFISHKLNEVLDIADRITVLRRGKKVDTIPREGATEAEPRPDDGRPRGASARRQGAAQPGETLLEVEDLHVVDDRGLEAVRGVSFDVRAGEIVGIAGVDGNGQTRADRRDHRPAARSSRGAMIASAAADVTTASARERARRPGSATSPRTGSARGLVLDFSLAENIALHDYAQAAGLAAGLALSRAG